MIEIVGVTYLIGQEEFSHIHSGIAQSLQTVMSQAGQTIQLYFHSQDNIGNSIAEIYAQAHATCKTINLDVDDCFQSVLIHSLNMFR